MTDLSKDSTGVQGLAQLGRNAIDRVSELERGIAYRDQMIRQLSEELDDLIKTDNETIRSLFAEQAKRDETVRQLRAQLDEYEREKLKRESQEPVAFRWLGPGKGWRAVYAAPPVPHIDPDWLANVISSHVSGQIGRGIGMDELRGCDLLAEKIAEAINGRVK